MFQANPDVSLECSRGHCEAAFGAMLDQIPPEVIRLAASFPHSSDGRIDYTDSSEATVMDCYVRCEERILILKRTTPIAGVDKTWHVVSGYLDRVRSLRDSVVEEIVEEIGVQTIRSMHAGRPYRVRDVKDWTVYPVGVELAPGGTIHLNEEHSAFAWIHPAEMARYLLPHVCRESVWLSP